MPGAQWQVGAGWPCPGFGGKAGFEPAQRRQRWGTAAAVRGGPQPVELDHGMHRQPLPERWHAAGGAARGEAPLVALGSVRLFPGTLTWGRAAYLCVKMAV